MLLLSGLRLGIHPLLIFVILRARVRQVSKMGIGTLISVTPDRTNPASPDSGLEPVNANQGKSNDEDGGEGDNRGSFSVTTLLGCVVL
jgi:hypothetical protein